MSSITPTAPSAVETSEVWCTAGQQRIDLLALSLLEHPAVLAARADALEQFSASPQFGVDGAADGIDAAVDNLLFSSLQFAANDNPAAPEVMWTVRLPYLLDGRVIPDSHYAADDPNRVYRCIGVGPEHAYEIRGRRHLTNPPFDDLSFEAIPGPGLYGRPMTNLQRDRIDIADDGTFTVTADATPADGRRNHLQLPAQTKSIVVRETLADWATQVPSPVTVAHTGGPDVEQRAREQIAAAGAELLRQSVGPTVKFLQACLVEGRENDLVAFERAVDWGVAGGLFAINPFAIGAGEALLITLDPLSARYLAITAADPWATTIAYDRHWSCLTNEQAQPNQDGSYTFALAAEDPGVHNWLDTGGNVAGAVIARWERFIEPPEPQDRDVAEADSATFAPGARCVPQAVREIRVLKLRDVRAAIPAGQALVSPDERRALCARRLHAYQVRVTGRPIDNEPHEESTR